MGLSARYDWHRSLAPALRRFERDDRRAFERELHDLSENVCAVRERIARLDHDAAPDSLTALEQKARLTRACAYLSAALTALCAARDDERSEV